MSGARCFKHELSGAPVLARERAGNTVNMTPSVLTPGLAPTYSHRAITHGPPPA